MIFFELNIHKLACKCMWFWHKCCFTIHDAQHMVFVSLINKTHKQYIITHTHTTRLQAFWDRHCCKPWRTNARVLLEAMAVSTRCNLSCLGVSKLLPMRRRVQALVWINAESLPYKRIWYSSQLSRKSSWFWNPTMWGQCLQVPRLLWVLCLRPIQRRNVQSPRYRQSLARASLLAMWRSQILIKRKNYFVCIWHQLKMYRLCCPIVNILLAGISKILRSTPHQNGSLVQFDRRTHFDVHACNNLHMYFLNWSSVSTRLAEHLFISTV